MSLIEEAAQIIEQAREEGRAAGRVEVEQEYFGKSAAVLTAQLFAASLGAAAQGLRPHSADAAAFFAQQAREMQDFATPAKVKSVEPTANATSVAVNNPISVQFTRKLDPSTINDEAMTVAPASGGAAKVAHVQYDEPTCTVSLQVENDLSPGVTYRVTVAGSIKAQGGQLLGSDHTWEFTTADA